MGSENMSNSSFCYFQGIVLGVKQIKSGVLTEQKEFGNICFYCCIQGSKVMMLFSFLCTKLECQYTCA